MHDRAKLAKAEIAALKIAYEQAIYEVYYGEETLEVYIGKCCPPLDYLITQGDYPKGYAERSLTDRFTWALITASNPYSQPLSKLENQQRYHQLIEHLQELQLPWLEALGKDRTGIWTPEQSLLILGIERSQAIAIGRKFAQNAIVFGELHQPAELQWL
jgi:hypothetical protein